METYFTRWGMLKIASDFIFFYPLVMMHVWLVGALFFYFKWERKQVTVPELAAYPPISILLPCHNEGENVRETIDSLLQQTYPAFEIIAINDGSTDNTGALLNEISRLHRQVRVVHFAAHQGKAMALRAGALMSANEFLVCIDGDALLDAQACIWMMSHLAAPNVGAVTGNARIRNRSTLLGKIQVGEFSSIVGIIKRAQRIYGRLFSVSGVVVAFRKRALWEVGFWTADMVTEDVDITWKLQCAGWEIRFEPNAKCWILIPETVLGLWRQRLRWAQGGSEVLLRNFGIFAYWKQRHMWLVFLEFGLSLLWGYTTVIVLLATVVALSTGHADALLPVHFVSTGNIFFILVLSSLLQFAVGIFLDSRYESHLWKTYIWIIWYPFLYWIMIVCATFCGFPKALLKKPGQRALWSNPDRGFKP
ncbi:MAG: glycosyl transferase family 2 [Herbaspirillum sp.]|nr:glycosyl transferase family 2 [Herbaspirillum sp.]